MTMLAIRICEDVAVQDSGPSWTNLCPIILNAQIEYRGACRDDKRVKVDE